VVTDPQAHTPTNPQTGPITIHCAAKLSVQCNNETRFTNAIIVLCHSNIDNANADERKQCIKQLPVTTWTFDTSVTGKARHQQNDIHHNPDLAYTTCSVSLPTALFQPGWYLRQKPVGGGK